MSVIGRVRRDREDLARVLKKHAGIRRIVEDLYPDSAHFIYELLQNAEDTGASDVGFLLSEDRLVFEHDGRSFDEADIRAITDIGDGTKADDDETIGRFGIGFKAVFAYTESPFIRSPTYSFGISDMVLPSELPPDPALGGRTRFEFPFDSPKKSPADAFSEVTRGLDELSGSTLLFLSHIDSIRWRIEGGRETRLLRISHSEHHVEILREVDGGDAESSHFLRFIEPVQGTERQYAAVAFELEPLTADAPAGGAAGLAGRFRVRPANPGRVAVYFTAAKETSNLRFHLHAPFVPELSRSSIKETPANEPLFRQLAALTAGSLFAIRDLGLLDRDFLAVLPNRDDPVPAPYECVRDAVAGAMKDRPLTPVHSGGHAPARRLLQAAAGLKALLDGDDIDFLAGGDAGPRDWAVAATRRNSLVDRYLRDLDIEEWQAQDFVLQLAERSIRKSHLDPETFRWVEVPNGTFFEWLSAKPADWHRALYAFLFDALGDRVRKAEDLRVVRLSTGEYRLGRECYFPGAGIVEDPIHPRVARDIYAAGANETEQERARAFLEAVGVREVGEYEQVEAILKQRYADPAAVRPWPEYEADLRRFLALVGETPNAGSLFADYHIFERADGQWSRPSGVYLDAPYLPTDLAAYFEPLGPQAPRLPLSGNYANLEHQGRFVDFALQCGVASQLEISEVTCRNNPHREYLSGAPGYHFTPTGTDRDFVVHGLDKLFEKPTVALSRLVWSTLRRRADDKSVLQARFQYNRSNYAHQAESQLVHRLRISSWIPQGDGAFVRPAEAASELLPEDFLLSPAWPWIEAIGFGEENARRAEERRKVQEMAEELGFEDDAALSDARRFAAFSPETRRRILDRHRSPADLPVDSPRDPDRRAEAVRERALQAPERTVERRQRSVSVNRDAIKTEQTVPYLRGLYTNPEGVTICQVCKDSLPFRLADGSHYFEAVQFLPELRRHHYQNYLVLCPNHAAMYRHANGSEGAMKQGFLAMSGNELTLILAGTETTAYFTETHIADLRAVIEAEDTALPENRSTVRAVRL